ncbi:MAG TPA: hypothetical protein VD993_15405 [Chitinophagaceae bacterium]|nr:hypothetical protein [Chitinophagaceae bacterium]
MPIQQYFDENQQLLKAEYEPLNETNIQKYLERFGKEKTEGYLEALKDVLTELDPVRFNRIDPGFSENTPHITQRKLREWAESKERFLEREDIKAFFKPGDQSSAQPQ